MIKYVSAAEGFIMRAPHQSELFVVQFSERQLSVRILVN